MAGAYGAATEWYTILVMPLACAASSAAAVKAGSSRYILGAMMYPAGHPASVLARSPVSLRPTWCALGQRARNAPSIAWPVFPRPERPAIPSFAVIIAPSSHPVAHGGQLTIAAPVLARVPVADRL